MTNGETMIVLLLLVIAYFLYEIVRQLSYLSGRRYRGPFSRSFWKKPAPQTRTRLHEEEEKKLPN